MRWNINFRGRWIVDLENLIASNVSMIGSLVNASGEGNACEVIIGITVHRWSYARSTSVIFRNRWLNSKTIQNKVFHEGFWWAEYTKCWIIRITHIQKCLKATMFRISQAGGISDVFGYDQTSPEWWLTQKYARRSFCSDWFWECNHGAGEIDWPLSLRCLQPVRTHIRNHPHMCTSIRLLCTHAHWMIHSVEYTTARKGRKLKQLPVSLQLRSPVFLWLGHTNMRTHKDTQTCNATRNTAPKHSDHALIVHGNVWVCVWWNAIGNRTYGHWHSGLIVWMNICVYKHVGRDT